MQRAICDYLTVRHHVFWRPRSYGIFDVNRPGHRALPKYSMRGLPDIIVIRAGSLVGLEVKRRVGRRSSEQKAFEQAASRAGATYHVVKSVDEVIALGL